jgi:anti-anti-sigma factor
MPPESTANILELVPVGDVAVLRFRQRSLLVANLIQAVAEQLRRAVEGGYHKLVLNFANVESMTTAMVGQLIGLQQTIESKAGRLVLCNVDAFVLEILKVLNLSRRFTVVADEQTALDGLLTDDSQSPESAQ